MTCSKLEPGVTPTQLVTYSAIRVAVLYVWSVFYRHTTPTAWFSLAMDNGPDTTLICPHIFTLWHNIHNIISTALTAF